MKYTEAGTYTLTYKAIDKCGNETEKERTVYVYEKKTVLFEDGTFIINELSKDRESNISKYGAVVKEYAPLDEDNPYVLAGGDNQMWFEERPLIKHLKFGTKVAPTDMSYWFHSTALEDIDWTNFDGSENISIRAFAPYTKLTEFAPPAMPNLENIRYVCYGCQNLTHVTFENVGATKITNTSQAFMECIALEEITLVGLAGTVNEAQQTFASKNNQTAMPLKTIYASADLDYSQATNSTAMFRGCVDLVGGNGTVFNASYVKNEYARIDTAETPGYFTAK